MKSFLVGKLATSFMGYIDEERALIGELQYFLMACR